MTMLAAKAEDVLKCKCCDRDVRLETETPGVDETDQTNYTESLQAYLDELGGIYCVDCR